MTEKNPYAADDASSSFPGKHNRLNNFLVLNASLFSVPMMLVPALWVLLELNGVHLSGSSGSVGLVTLLISVCYVAIPNLVMVIMRRSEIRLSTKQPKTR